MSVNYLNDDVLIHIFTFLDWESLNKASAVCKKWHLIINDTNTLANLSARQLHSRLRVNYSLTQRRKGLFSRLQPFSQTPPSGLRGQALITVDDRYVIARRIRPSVGERLIDLPHFPKQDFLLKNIFENVFIFPFETCHRLYQGRFADNEPFLIAIGKVQTLLLTFKEKTIMCMDVTTGQVEDHPSNKYPLEDPMSFILTVLRSRVPHRDLKQMYLQRLREEEADRARAIERDKRSELALAKRF